MSQSLQIRSVISIEDVKTIASAIVDDIVAIPSNQVGNFHRGRQGSLPCASKEVAIPSNQVGNFHSEKASAEKAAAEKSQSLQIRSVISI